MQLLVRINPADFGVEIDPPEGTVISLKTDRSVPKGEAKLYDARGVYLKSINLRGQEHTGQQGGGDDQRIRR